MKHYTDIDEMPIWNWFKIQETSDLRYVMIERKETELTEQEAKTLSEAFSKMTDQYIDAFGISDTHSKIITLETQIRIAEIDYALSKDRIHLTTIDVLKSKLQAVLLNGQKRETVNVKVHVEKFMGFRIDMKTTSVKDFYGYLKELQREFKKK